MSGERAIFYFTALAPEQNSCPAYLIIFFSLSAGQQLGKILQFVELHLITLQKAA